MIKVAINTKPLSSGHKTRGVGFYTRNLVEELKKNSSLEIIEFSEENKLKKVEAIHYPWFDLFFRSLPLRKSAPTIVTIHDVIPLVFSNKFPPGKKGKINNFFQRLSLRTCKYVITDSYSSKKDIVKYLKIREDKIKVVYFAAEGVFKELGDVAKIKIKNKLKLPDNYLLYVGDVNFTKNLPFLIKGFAVLKKDPKFSDLKLVLVGSSFLKNVENIDHPELASIKEVNQLIKDGNLEKDIHRLGFIQTEDLIGVYNLAKIYIQPSLYEGFGIPVLEAMACGIPVICSNTSSLPEVGGEAAMYFNPRELDEFVKLTRNLLLNSALRNELLLKGLKQSKRFSMERVADETVEVYKQAIQ